MIEKMSQHKGVHIPMFAKITWEFSDDDTGGVKVRPVFTLTEDFCRSHKLPYKKPTDAEAAAHAESRAACSELNLSALALRHSQTLTKDMVFTNLRDIFRKLGELVARGL